MLLIAAIFVLMYPFGLVYSSYFEWVFHRYVMHRAWFMYSQHYILRLFRFLDYPFRTHTLTHHKLYRADESYHYSPERVAKMAKERGWNLKAGETKITMAWWNGPLIIFLGPFPFHVVALVFWYFGPTEVFWTIVGTGLFAGACYYGTYEYFHYCMHHPKKRRLEQWRLFKFIDDHHLLHHLKPGKNFNVILPIFDYLLGTLITPAEVSLPNVQRASVLGG